MIRVLADELDTSLRSIERQIDQRLEPLVFGDDALEDPFVIGPRERDLDIVLWMHAEQQHGGGEDHLIIEAHGVHGATGKLREVMAAGSGHGLGEACLVRDAAVNVLEVQA
jgi:hypothetical protein